jgi:hypothetical protein
MCHSRNTEKLARFTTSSNHVLSNAFLRQTIDRRDSPRSNDLLHAANRSVVQGNTRYYHLDGSRDMDAAIVFLASDGVRARLLEAASHNDDIETQWAARSVSIGRQRLWLNGGRGQGEDDDFRIIEDMDGKWLVRLRTGETPPDSAIGSVLGVPFLDDDASTLADATEISTPGSPALQFSAPTGPERAEVNARLYNIVTRVNTYRGFPSQTTRLEPQYLSALDDIERLTGLIRRLPPGISEDTFTLLDAWLDDLAWSSSRARLRHQPGTTANTHQAEPRLEINWINPAYPQTPTVFSPSSSHHSQPRAFSIPSLSPSSSESTFATHLQLQNIVSSLESMLQSPNLPSRATFSAVRRAFDTISTHLESHPQTPLSNTVSELVSTARGLFWILARRAFPDALTASDARLVVCAARRGRDGPTGRRVSAWF